MDYRYSHHLVLFGKKKVGLKTPRKWYEWRGCLKSWHCTHWVYGVMLSCMACYILVLVEVPVFPSGNLISFTPEALHYYSVVCTCGMTPCMNNSLCVRKQAPSAWLYKSFSEASHLLELTFSHPPILCATLGFMLRNFDSLHSVAETANKSCACVQCLLKLFSLSYVLLCNVVSRFKFSQCVQLICYWQERWARLVLIRLHTERCAVILFEQN